MDQVGEADPNQDPLVPGIPETPRHLVKPHSRKLPPARPPADLEDHLTLDFDVERVEPPPRFTTVRPHVRRNPRPRSKETPVSMPIDVHRVPDEEAISYPSGRSLVSPDPVGLARAHDPQTSHDAAQAVLDGPVLTKSYAWVLATFRQKETDVPTTEFPGFIDSELEGFAEVQGVRFSPQRVRTARHDLYEAGYLAKAGTTRTTRYGRQAEVYVLTERGRTASITPYADDRTDGA